MGSIYGAVLEEGKKANPQIAKNLSELSSWWNPHSAYDYVNQNVILGQQNLHSHAQVLLEKSEIFKHPSNYKIISDARIDNRADLIRELQLNRSASNSKIILELYLKYGEGAPSKLVGAFSFAIWSPVRKTLFCARDQIGVKPLNYYWGNGVLIFATQKKCILTFDKVDKSPDWRNIFNNISGMGIPPNSTSYLHIKSLPPAHYMLYENGVLKIKEYWSLDISKRTTYKKDQDYVNQFKELFKQAISDRMDSTGKIGTHLSGGLDSSGISAFAHEIGKKNNNEVLFYSYNVEEKYLKGQKQFQENALAYDFIKFHNAKDQFINVHKHVPRSYSEMVEHEALFCDALSRSNNVNTEYELQHAAKEHNTNVILSGFPGDELVTSFCRPYYLEYYSQGKWLKYFTKKMKSRHSRKEKMNAFAGALLSSISSNLGVKIGTYYNEKRVADSFYIGNSHFLNRSYFDEHNDYKEMLEAKYYPMVHYGFPTSLKIYQKNHICRPHTSRRMESENLVGLKWGLEYRYPMADIRVLQYMLSIPMEQKISSQLSRRIFRLATKGLIPESIRLRDIKTAGSLKPMVQIYKRNFGRSPWDLWQKFEQANCAPFLNPTAIKIHLKNKERSPMGVYNLMVLGQLGFEKKMKF